MGTPHSYQTNDLHICGMRLHALLTMGLHISRQNWTFAHLRASCLHICGWCIFTDLHICGRRVCTNWVVCTFEGESLHKCGCLHNCGFLHIWRLHKGSLTVSIALVWFTIYPSRWWLIVQIDISIGKDFLTWFISSLTCHPFWV